MKSYYSLSVCTPARASLMTGRYPVRFGMQYDVILSGAPWGLPFSEKIFPEYMKDAGYETHMVGKWHLGSYTQDSIPSQRGFDSFMGYLNGEEMYWTHRDPSSILHGRKFYDFGFGNATGYFDIIDRPPLDPAHAVEDDDAMLSPTTTSSSSMPGDGNGPIAGQYSTQVFQDRAIAILEGKTPFDEEPLYMYLSHQAVHPPLGLPPAGCFSAEETAILDRVKANSNEDGHMRQRFAKVLMYLDRTIGDLVDYLEKEGWMENSIIVVASDNGGCYSSGGSCYPFRGNKDSYWEGGTKVPAFVYSTSHIPEERWGTEYDGMMHVTDWLPTIAAGVGMDLDGGAGSLDGINHWDSILNAEEEAGNASPRQEILYNLDPYSYLYLADDSAGGKGADNLLAKGAIRSGKYKYIMNEYCAGWYTFDKPTLEEDPLTNLETVCNGNTCSHCSGKACTGQYFDYLFDLDTDPREEHNLIEIFPEVAETLRNRMLEVAFEEWTDPLLVDIDMRSYYVWAQYNWWMVPWWDLAQGATEDPFGISGTSISTSDGLTPAASGAQ
ncbi:unnamed protein product [Pylaiella littoralis]